MRRSIAVLFALTLAVGRAAPVAAAPCWEPPVAAPVADPYREPACPWCPGNRGITYATPPGVAVRAVAAGRVTFAGDVAGTVYVVVRLANGWRLTYGNLDAADVAEGDPIVAGLVLGRAAGPFHFGLRDGDGDDAYRDPAPFLGTWRYRVRLIPLDGPAPPAPPPTLTCAGASTSPAATAA